MKTAPVAVTASVVATFAGDILFRGVAGSFERTASVWATEAQRKRVGRRNHRHNIQASIVLRFAAHFIQRFKNWFVAFH
jgi:hypothetical protein